ncbi:DUF5807 family protein [Halocatena halophila]|uniref:DUF5807 family protein n=1 Tax=Halocatena halophila TaxID=2814576 RepID=UPI002ED1146E
MNERRRSFLAGERLDDVLLYLSDAVVSNAEELTEYGDTVDDGVVLVLSGEKGRTVFEQAVGVPAMTFASGAMETEGTIEHDCTHGDCPVADPSDPHELRFVLAFGEAQNEDVGGIYAEGDVIHAYGACTCGESYSDRWLATE